MKWLGSIGTAILEFVIGEDWWAAMAVVVTLAIVLWSVHLGANWWWLLPLAVSAIVVLSVARATRAKPESPATEEGPPRH